MNKIFIRGEGAVSPAGWGMAALRISLDRGEPLPTKELARPGWTHPLLVRTVPAAPSRPAFLAHARLRRTSPIAHFAVAAALEALGTDSEQLTAGTLRLGIVMCVMSGCVNYSRRFYDETLKNPATASPLVFPETVFNAPSSHLAALLGTTAVNYTLVGDPGTFCQGLALAADWLLENRVDGCLVVGAEEMDWLTAEALTLFSSEAQISEGAGAVYLRRDSPPSGAIELAAITDSHSFNRCQTRAAAARKMRLQLANNGSGGALYDGLLGVQRSDRDEAQAWLDWHGDRFSIKRILGEGLTAAAAWQCVAAVDALRQGHCPVARVSIVGCNHQAIGATFALSAR